MLIIFSECFILLLCYSVYRGGKKYFFLSPSKFSAMAPVTINRATREKHTYRFIS